MAKKHRYIVVLNLTEYSASDEPWNEKDMAKRLEEKLNWHAVAQEVFCELKKVEVTLH